MAKCRLKETKFLNLYGRGKEFEERYKRRKRSGDCTEMHEKMLVSYHKNMELVKLAIDAVEHKPYKQLLYMRFVLLMNTTEIAEELNDSPENVARKMYRAIHAVTVPEGVID